MNFFQTLILSIIEGITEFLPISSTGHMIIGASAIGLEQSEYVKLFTVSIQLGAILSVVVLYFKRFFKSMNFYYKLLAGFIPTGILGLLFNDFIESMLENVYVVAINLLLGGIILLFVDKWFKKQEIDGKDEPTYKNAGFIGLFQSLAMLPGVSRSAASIIGGLVQGLNRKAAAEFSFFLAVPTMFAATAKSLWDHKELLATADLKPLILGNIIAFVVALLAIKSFIGFVQKRGFKVFGIYRIILGLILLGVLLSGHSLQII